MSRARGLYPVRKTGLSNGVNRRSGISPCPEDYLNYTTKINFVKENRLFLRGFEIWRIVDTSAFAGA
jgi:hypothetical protein